MNITIIGASAGVRLETVKSALDRNHHVTSLSQREINFPSNSKLSNQKGKTTNKEDLKKAINNALETGKA